MFSMSDQVNELAGALSKAQSEMGHAAKDAKNPHFRAEYATLASVLDAVRPVLAKHGISFVQPAGDDDRGNVVVETVLFHSSGQWMRSDISCAPSKRDAQAIGSVVSYLRRYSLCSMVGIAQADDDAEGEQDRRKAGRGADVQVPPPQRQKPPAPQQSPAPTDFWSSDTLRIAAQDAKDLFAKLRARAAEAPTLESIDKLEADNADGLNAMPDAGRDKMLEIFMQRRAALAQAPAEKTPFDEAA